MYVCMYVLMYLSTLNIDTILFHWQATWSNEILTWFNLPVVFIFHMEWSPQSCKIWRLASGGSRKTSFEEEEVKEYAGQLRVQRSVEWDETLRSPLKGVSMAYTQSLCYLFLKCMWTASSCHNRYIYTHLHTHLIFHQLYIEPHKSSLLIMCIIIYIHRIWYIIVWPN